MKDPRKKAEQLIRAYINVMPPLHPNISTGERILSYAKASSLLHVKEMLKIEDLFNPNRKYDLLSDLYYDFWRKVKKEIINIKVGELKF